MSKRRESPSTFPSVRVVDGGILLCLEEGGLQVAAWMDRHFAVMFAETLCDRIAKIPVDMTAADLGLDSP
jgi:hypothetical protein